MRSPCNHLFGLCVIGMALGISAPSPAQAASGIGPYYATPSWDQTLPAGTRFIVLTNMNSEAVLDRETGLVWEKAPSETIHVGWSMAHSLCLHSTVGGRMGWRLPSEQELSSLVDRTQVNPALPAGHPFVLDFNLEYWSSTMTDSTAAVEAWGVLFTQGNVGHEGIGSPIHVWCVRGGTGTDVQGH